MLHRAFALAALGASHAIPGIAQKAAVHDEYFWLGEMNKASAAIIANRASVGGPQPAEMERMLTLARRSLAQQDEWIKRRQARINGALARLRADFDKLSKNGG